MIRMDSTENLSVLAAEIRYIVTDMICRAGSGHIGGSLSIVEILLALYYRVMHTNPADLNDPRRDRLVLSKGHAGPALYAVLAHKGIIPFDWLATLNKPGTRLPSHVDRRTPGVEMTAGSLGQGLSAACGMALAAQKTSPASRVFCIIGDGESQEGQVWEAALFAAHRKLSNLVGITDYNGMQIDGTCDEVMSLGDLEAKWRSFDWDTVTVDGHDIPALIAAFKPVASAARPRMVIARTVKARGNACFEGQVGSHHIRIADDAARKKYLEGVSGASRTLPY